MKSKPVQTSNLNVLYFDYGSYCTTVGVCQ